MHVRARRILRSAMPWMITASLVVSGTSALAVDGVLEINQQCAAVGCFPGDGAGFPVTVSLRGSFRLTSDLDVSGEVNPENVTAIEITGGGVQGTTIDLNGFRILGPTECLGAPPTSCTPAGTGRGITSTNNWVTVRNGRILGMGGIGVRLVSAARVEDLHVESCGGSGIEIAGNGAYISGNVVRRNGDDGIITGQNALVKDNLLQDNVTDGLVLGANSGYVGNVMVGNGGSNLSGSPGVQLGVNQCGIAACP